MHRPAAPRRSLLLAAALALLALVVAACGGSTASGGGVGAAGTSGKAAAAFPATSLFYADANIDQGSDAWKKAEALAARFPGWAKVKAQFQAELAKGDSSGSGVSFKDDIQPWLGGEAGIAVTGVKVSGTSGTEPTVVGYVESKDDSKLEAALTKDGDTRKTGSYKGYDLFTGKDGKTYAAVGKNALLVSNDQNALRGSVDLNEGTGDSLASLDRFKTAVGNLPEDNLVVGYVDGPAVRQLVQLAQARGGAAASGISQAQLEQGLSAFHYATFSFGPQDEGFRVHATANVDRGKLKQLNGGQEFSSFTPDLGKRVPGNSYFYLETQNLGTTLQSVLNMQGTSTAGAMVGTQLKQFETSTGISFTNDLVPLLSGEHALYVGPGLPVSLGLLLKPADAAKGAATMKKVTAAISKLVPGASFTPLGTSEQGERATVSGQTVLWRRDGDTIAIGNDANVGKQQSPSIQDSDTYKRVAKEAGLSDQVGFLAYADVPSIVNLAQTAGTTTDAETRANLQHVGAFLGWGEFEGDDVSEDLFLEIRK